MILLMTVAAVVCVLQLGVLGSWGRTVRLSTLLLAVALGFYACGIATVLLQLAWTRAFAALTGTPVYDVVATAAWTVDPVIEEVVKVLPVVLLAWRWRRTHRQLGLTDHLLAGAALGVGFELFEAALRFSTLGSFAMSVDGGYAVRASLAGVVVVPSLWTSLTTWQPVPAAFEDFFSTGGDSVQHLVWTALAAVGVGWFVRRGDAWRWLGVAGVTVACLDHMNYNWRVTASGAGWPSDALAWLGARLPAVLVLLLVAVVAADRLLLARVRAAHPRVLLPAEGATGLDPRPVLARARSGAPWSSYVTWRFVLARRAALFAESAGLAPPRLVDAVVADKERLERATAWDAVGRRLRRRPSFAALRSWQSVVWVLAVLPAVVYLVVGAFPATSGVQDAMRGTVGLWLLVAAAVGTTVLVAAQVPPLLAGSRAVLEPSIHETRMRLQVRLGTAGGALVGGLLTVVVALVRRDADRNLVSSFHALDALGNALLVLGLALFVASLFLFPPFGLAVVAGTGELILVSTMTSAFVASAAASAALAGTGILLSEASEGSGGSSSEGGAAADDAAAAARQRRIDELSADPAHGGASNPGTIAEAEVGLGLEERGAVQGLRRSTHPGEEFRDALGQAWDVKAFRSTGFNLDKAMAKIRMEMIAGKENVMLDTRHLSPGDLARLRDAVESATTSGRLPLKVLWWP